MRRIHLQFALAAAGAAAQVRVAMGILGFELNARVLPAGHFEQPVVSLQLEEAQPSLEHDAQEYPGQGFGVGDQSKTGWWWLCFYCSILPWVIGR